jgi:thymidylate synthase (FAD)
MKVRLISATPGIEEHMAYVARVSSPNQTNPEFAKLLKYCLRKGHWSVFEHGYITLEIDTTRAIARQIIRHRSFAFSEFSQRYAEVKEEPTFVEARTQDLKNRQSSHPTEDPLLTRYWEQAQSEVWSLAKTWYENALSMGIAKEQARALLPEGMTPSRIYMSGTVRSWIHYIQVRSENGTQKEHSAVALECKRILRDVIPTVIEILDEEEVSSIRSADKTK